MIEAVADWPKGIQRGLKHVRIMGGFSFCF